MNTKKKIKPELKKHAGSVKRPLKVNALEIHQGETVLYAFKAKASVLYDSFSVNRRVEDKDEGYQRVLSPSRVGAVSRYITELKKSIPGAIVVSIDHASSFDKGKGILTVPAGTDVGWVIDGQHRMIGAAMAAREGRDIELAVVAYRGLSIKGQIEQFITINREAKNVPTSLYLDLLHNLSFKSAGDQARERATDLATQLRRDEDSPFFERIAVTTAPKAGQISLVNFVRKITPHVTRDKGILGTYSEREQVAVISNYFKGLAQVFHREFNSKESIFFKTVGFGGVWNAFQTVFSITLKNHSGFSAKDVVQILKRIDTFDFEGWLQYGTGNAAELTAGEDLRTAISIAFTDDQGPTGSLRV
jgi:DGQHR domain-containing protein